MKKIYLVPGWMYFVAWMKAGTFVPPSYREPLKPLRGWLGEEVVVMLGAPLSEKKRIMESSYSFFAFSSSTIFKGINVRYKSCGDSAV